MDDQHRKCKQKRANPRRVGLSAWLLTTQQGVEDELRGGEVGRRDRSTGLISNVRDK